MLHDIVQMVYCFNGKEEIALRQKLADFILGMD